MTKRWLSQSVTQADCESRNGEKSVARPTTKNRPRMHYLRPDLDKRLADDAHEQSKNKSALLNEILELHYLTKLQPKKARKA